MFWTKHLEWKGENHQTDDILVIGIKCMVKKIEEKLDYNNINWQGKKILIVEDDPDCSMLLQLYLEKCNVEFLLAYNGKEAVEICKNNEDIDIILMDIQMAVMDGNEAIAQIKRFRKNLPIIVQTAYPLDGEKEKSFKSGCDDYIAKPIDPEKLYDKIHKLINYRIEHLE